MKNIFRSIVVTQMIALVSYWLLPLMYDQGLSSAQRELVDLNGIYSVLPTNAVMYWGLLGVWLGASVGVFLFLGMARALFAVVVLITIGMTPFSGFVVLTPLEATVSAVIGILNGVIVGLAFLSPVSREFSGSRAKSQV